MEIAHTIANEAVRREPEVEEGYREEEDIALAKRGTVEEETDLYEEGYGIGDAEPAGTNTYDMQDEWN